MYFQNGKDHLYDQVSLKGHIMVLLKKMNKEFESIFSNKDFIFGLLKQIFPSNEVYFNVDEKLAFARGTYL